MTKPRFFEARTELTVGEIVALTGAKLIGDAPLAHRIADIAPLDLAGSRDVTYIDSAKYSEMLDRTRAGACFMTERFEKKAPSNLIVLRTDQPYRAFVAVARRLFPESLRPSSLYDGEGVSMGASVHPTARLETGVTIDPGAVIGPRAQVGAGTTVGATAVIGPDVCIGRDCAIGAASSVIHALIGDRVTIHPGCRIGQDGFGFLPDKAGYQKIPQLGRVIVQDDVEIGAGTAIDRGGVRDTFIGEGTKIDNLVQIGHNVVIGRHCVIVAQSGLSGSVTLEDFVVLAGRVGVVQHVTIGEGAHLGARSWVLRDVPRNARWWGAPAKPVRQWIREMLTLERLAARGAAKPPASDEHTDLDR